MNIFIKVKELEDKFEEFMRSEAQTFYKKRLNNKLSIIIFLWFLDKLIMLFMFYLVK